MEPMAGPRRTRDRLAALFGVGSAAIGLHVLMVMFLVAVGLPGFDASNWERPVSVRLLDGDVIPGNVTPPTYDASVMPLPTDAEDVPEEEPPEDPDTPDGQIVETAPPKEEKIPVDADYLAEHDTTVPEEMRSRKFKVNPEILAPTYSDESKMELEERADVGATEASTGAMAGGTDEASPGKGPPKSLIPSQFLLTNKEGLAAPVLASGGIQDVRGAPQNDLLDEKYGPGVALNTREFYGAEYINRIRRQVNFYWKQNIDNLSPSVRLGKPRYLTVVSVVLTADGVLESIVVAESSDSTPIDDCVVQAFRIAGPYPNPPAQLIGRDGRVRLPEFDFTVNIGQAQMQYQGVDPRANVQFPGILNAPR